ncbi:MAG: hypothetical protein GF390_01665 [Candidatus Pacebacteria bacterium]|nr:hypothetical protein [Candidatus Paceibacterota bacterium]
MNNTINSPLLYPAILTDSLQVVQKQLDLVKDQAAVSVVQLDVIDGQFVDNLTVTPADLLELDWGNLKVDFHLMTNEPMDYVWELIEVEKELPIRAVIAQVERMSYQADFFQEVARHGWQAGLSLDLYTPLSAVDDSIWAELNLIQLMGIKAGFQGQQFQDQVLAKLQKLQDLVNQRELSLEILVDGGVKLINAAKLIKAGATGLVVGSALWQAQDLDQVVKQFNDFAKQ